MATINTRFENLTLERLQEIYDIVSVPVSTGLTIGTTLITGGTVGRILFQGTGNVLQQSGNLFWDNTNGRLGIGTATPTGAVTVIGAYSSGTAAPLVVQNTLPYGSPFNQYSQIWLNSSGSVMASLRNNGEFTVSSTIATQYFRSGTAGSASTPIYGGSGSNGIFFPAANTMAFTTNAVEAMRIFSTRNIGIGTTTDAGFKVDINGTARVQGNATIVGTLSGGSASAVTSYSSMAFGEGSAATASWSYAFGRQSNANAEQSFAIGGRARTYLYGQFAQASTLFSSGNYNPFYGIAQASTLTPFKINTTLTSGASLVLALNGAGALIIPDGNDRVWHVIIDSIAVVSQITGTATGVSIGDLYRETKELAFKRRNGTSSIVGGVDTRAVKSDTSMASSFFTISNGTSQEMKIEFTAPTFAGGGSLFFKVISKVSLVELTYN